VNQEEFATKFQSLTPKPRSVLALILLGRSDEEIAAELDMSAATVRKHIQNLCDRFELKRKINGLRRNRREDLINLTIAYQSEIVGSRTESFKLEESDTEHFRTETGAGRPLAIAPLQPSTLSEMPTRQSQDWGEAVDVSVFFGRTEELDKLEKWIVKDRCRLIAVLGMGGIGKTSLSVKLAQQIAAEFETVIWRSLRNAPVLENVLTDLLNVLLNKSETKADLSRLIDHLKQHRCLIVLDNVETILQSGEGTLRDRVGRYREGYETYGELFRQLGEVQHQSCLILTSREKPKEIASLEGKTLPVRSLQLAGLKETEGQQVLKAKGFSGSEARWAVLINRYAGNPLALKIVATAIHDLFDGNIDNFLEQVEQGTAVFGEIRDLLDQQLSRISNLEQEVMYWLAINREPISITELRDDVVAPISLTELLEVLESLNRRSLIEKNLASFTQQPVVMEYVTEQIIEQAYQEIDTCKIALLNSHALIKARAKDYIRNTQINLILKPIIHRLKATLGSDKTIEDRLVKILSHLQIESPLKPGYVSGNILNLLVQLKQHLQNYDFSDLTIWQAYLQGINLHRVNFTNSNLEKSVFSDTFGSILSVAFSPDGKLLVTGDANGEVRLWRVMDGEQLLTYGEHTGWVRSVSFSPDGQRLASGSDDKTLKLWEVSTGKCLQTIEGHTSGIQSVAFSPDGSTLASGSSDQTIKLWSAETGQCQEILLAHTDWVRSVCFSADGRLLASGGSDRTVRLWEVSTGQCVNIFYGHTRSIRAVSFSPDGRLLASGSSDHTVKLWDVAQGTELNSLFGHAGRVWSVAFSPDSQMLISGSDDQTVRLWDIKTGQCLETLQGHTSRVWSVAFSADGRTLASGSDDQTVRLWDSTTGQQLETLQGYTRSLRSVAFAPGSTAQILGSSLTIDEGAIAPSPSPELKGRILASGSDDHKVRLWDVYSGRCLKAFQGHASRVWSVAFSPDGKTLASGSDDQTVRLWDVGTGKCLHVLSGHTNWIRAIAFHPSGQLLASGSDDQKIRLWEVSSGECLTTLRGHTNWVWSVAFSPDGQLLASGGNDQTVRLWDVNSRQCVKVLQGHTDWVRCVAFMPHSQSLILASSSNDQTVRLWDVHTGRCLSILQEHTNRVRSIAFSQDGQILACGGEDNSIGLWDIKTGHCIKTLQGHTDWVRTVAFSLHGNILASGGKDETIALWDVETGDRLQTLKTEKPYEGTNITGVTGLSETQKATLIALGAVIQ
jgi:WD40 repeat protein